MIKWITDSLGTAAWEEAHEQTGVHVVDVRDMVDKPGNRTNLVEQKIREVLAHLAAGRKVIVACDYGISRSNAIAVGALARSQNLPFNEAVKRVMSKTGEKSLRVDVLAKVRDALGVSRPLAPSHGSKDSRRILVTGGTGFLGKALIPELQAAHEVVFPSRLEVDLTSGSVDLDLMVKDKGIDCIVHLANPRIYTTNSAMGESLTILRNVLDVCRENDVRFLYPSSWEVYSGYRSQQLVAAEELPRWPKGPYGEAKHLCETLIDHHCRMYRLNYAILRSSPVYGGGDRPKFINHFIRKAISGEVIWAHRYRNGFPVLDLLHLSDMVSALTALIGSDLRGSVNIGSGKGVSTTQVANMTIEMLSSKSTINHREIDDFAPNVIMDISHAQSALGWEPKMDLTEGLRFMIQDAVDSARIENR